MYSIHNVDSAQDEPQRQASSHLLRAHHVVENPFESHSSTREQHRRLSMVMESSHGGDSFDVASADETTTTTKSQREDGFWFEEEVFPVENSRYLSESVNGSVNCADITTADPGWLVIFYVIGVLYTFLAIAIVCDEYFVEALEVISDEDHMNLDRDVAGATLMAAGGSAPELFTNLFGTFDQSEIGIGTIVGSAVFNVLLVIAMCSIAAKETLDLTWWPLFRDSTYYAIGLVVLAIFVGVVSPNRIEIWEAVVLFLMYIGYVLIMWKNRDLHLTLTGKDLPPDANDDTSAGDDESGNLEAIKEKFDALMGSGDEQDDNAIKGGVTEEQLRELLTSVTADVEDFNLDEAIADVKKQHEVDVITWDEFSDWYRNSPYFAKKKKEEEDENEQLYAILMFPEDAGPWGKLWHALQLPILTFLVFTVPDVRRPGLNKGKWCYLAFFISILWIGFFAYFMVYWAEVIGNTVGIPHVVMGYTVLAAGTSVPDLLSSVIVTRQGSGDMAISSSIGSNIFDITVGLPIPWLIWMAFPKHNNYIDVSTRCGET